MRPGSEVFIPSKTARDLGQGWYHAYKRMCLGKHPPATIPSKRTASETSRGGACLPERKLPSVFVAALKVASSTALRTAGRQWSTESSACSPASPRNLREVRRSLKDDLAACSASRTEINSSTCDSCAGTRKAKRPKRNRKKRRMSLTLFLRVSAARPRQHLSSTEGPAVAPVALEKGRSADLAISTNSRA